MMFCEIKIVLLYGFWSLNLITKFFNTIYNMRLIILFTVLIISTASSKLSGQHPDFYSKNEVIKMLYKNCIDSYQVGTVRSILIVREQRMIKLHQKLNEDKYICDVESLELAINEIRDLSLEIGFIDSILKFNIYSANDSILSDLSKMIDLVADQKQFINVDNRVIRLSDTTFYNSALIFHSITDNNFSKIILKWSSIATGKKKYLGNSMISDEDAKNNLYFTKDDWLNSLTLNTILNSDFIIESYSVKQLYSLFKEQKYNDVQNSIEILDAVFTPGSLLVLRRDSILNKLHVSYN